MVYTFNDYADQLSTGASYSEPELLEQAVRLGSISVFERSGTTLFMDDFEAPTLKWEVTGSGTGAEAVLSTTYILKGSQSCKITGGSTADKSLELIRRLPAPAVANFGLEFAYNYNSNIDDLTITLYYYDSLKEHKAQIIIDYASQFIKYLDSAGDKLAVNSLPLPYDSADLFHNIKLVADFINNKYVKLIYDDTEYDISSYSYYRSNSANEKHIAISIKITHGEATTQSIYLDSCIFTTNES